MKTISVPASKKYRELSEKLIKRETDQGNWRGVLSKALKWLEWHGIDEKYIDIHEGAESWASGWMKIDAAIASQGSPAQKKYFTLYPSKDKAAAVIDADCNIDFSGMRLAGLPEYIRWRRVSGDFNVSNNALKSLKGMPEAVEGWLNCDGNMISNFKGATCREFGAFSADVQKAEPDYPLTEENLKLFLDGKLTENSVLAGPSKKLGELAGIDESAGVAYVRFDKEKGARRYALDEVFPIHAPKLAKGLQS